MGVIGGSTMTLETESGQLTVVTGKKITMTLAEPETAVAATSGSESGGMSKRTQYILGAIAAGVIVAGGIALAGSGGSGSSSSSGSPAAP
ncbi:MAG: hypothetical protein PVF38_06990 [Desulfobacterales bacterium]